MLFQFNVYSSLLLPAFIQGVLFAILLGWRGLREGRLSDKLLAFLLLLFTLRVAQWMLGFAGWYDAHNAYSTFMFYFPFNHWLLLGPLMYFYFQSLTNAEFRFNRKHWYHFLSGAIWLTLVLVIFVKDVLIDHWWLDNPFLYHFGTKGSWRQSGLDWVDHVFAVLDYLSVSFYLIITLRLYRRYQRYVNDNFSDTDGINYAWLGGLLYAFVIALAVYILFVLADTFGAKPLSYIQYWYAYFAWGLIIYYLSIAGSQSPHRMAFFLHFEPEKEPDAPATDEMAELIPFRDQLQAWMAAQTPYLNPELTLHELAGQLKMQPATLSKVINVCLNKNFNDFINEYRVEAVKALLLDPGKRHLSLLSLAFEGGFNSKATFNRAFRKHAELAPSEFLRQQLT